MGVHDELYIRFIFGEIEDHPDCDLHIHHYGGDVKPIWEIIVELEDGGIWIEGHGHTVHEAAKKVWEKLPWKGSPK